MKELSTTFYVAGGLIFAFLGIALMVSETPSSNFHLAGIIFAVLGFSIVFVSVLDYFVTSKKK